jgi:DNA-binding response OmpR family regulator
MSEPKSLLMNPETSKPSLLGGHSALVVEDETIISLEIEQMLQDLDCEIVWHAATIAQAFRILSEHRPDLAILDVNLGNEKVFPLAKALVDRTVPFIFSTGYGREGLPLEWADWPVIRKPYRLRELAAVLRPLLGA